MKRAYLLFTLYTSAVDPGSALFCNVDDSTYYVEAMTVRAESCVADRVFKASFD